MDLETIRRLNLARHLYELGIGSLRTTNDTHLFSAVNLLQDAVEAFLLAIAEHVHAVVDQNTKFDKYFVEIEKRIAPKELPFKTTLHRLNRVRVDSKHYGIQPARDECERFALAVREFFDEVARSLLSANFSTISAIDLLAEGEPKNALLEAKAFLDKGVLLECAIECRKALYLEIERHYDVTAYKDGKPVGLFDGFTKAPYFARSKEYLDKHVLDPTDLIIYDHSALDQELLTDGVDNTAFWNVWRLTPKVYQKKDGAWVIKHEFAKLDDTILADKIEYIFAATVDILLSIHSTRQKTRVADHGHYVIELTRENVPIYRKADKSSEIVQHTPAKLTQLDADYRVEGLIDPGPYWRISHLEGGLFLVGFVHNEDVK